MATDATLDVKLQLKETTSANELQKNKDIVHIFDQLVKLTSSTTAPVTKVYAQELQLSGGALTVNLTSLTDGVGAALTMDGLKVQFICIVNNPASGAANTGTLNVVAGAVDGFPWAGDTASEATLAVGGFVVIYNPEGTADVAAAVDQIDFSSADTDAEFQILIAAG